MPRRLLVTGAAGYIGAVLVRHLLAAGYEVRAVDALLFGGESLIELLDVPGFEFRKADVRDHAAMTEAVRGTNAVIHLAAIVGDPACAREPELAESVNVHASIELYRSAVAAGVERFVFASTCSNYGKAADPDAFVDEASPLVPVSRYARTKVAVESFLLDAAASAAGHGVTVPTCLRFATVYGLSPRPRFDLTVNEFVLEMLTGKELLVFGEQFWRPYIHVCDVAEAVVRVLEAPPTLTAGQVFNVGATDQNFTKAMLVEAIRPHAPEAEVRFVRKEEDPRDYRVSFERIEQVLGFTGHWNLERGIEELVSLIRSGVLSDPGDARFRN